MISVYCQLRSNDSHLVRHRTVRDQPMRPIADRSHGPKVSAPRIDLGAAVVSSSRDGAMSCRCDPGTLAMPCRPPGQRPAAGAIAVCSLYVPCVPGVCGRGVALRAGGCGRGLFARLVWNVHCPPRLRSERAGPFVPTGVGSVTAGQFVRSELTHT